MRIISGDKKSQVIIAPKGNSTRPTQDYIRESLFNIIFKYIADAVVLDLFAGSGALGFESLSRGAAHCYFVDVAYNAIRTLHMNAEKLKYDKEINIIKSHCDAALRNLSKENVKFDLIFLDPPYKIEDLNLQFNMLVELDLLKSEAIIIWERSNNKIEIKSDKFKLFDTRKYGITEVLMYQYKKGDE